MRIKDWATTPQALAIERNYKELGLIKEDSSWSDFEFTESTKAWEEYQAPPHPAILNSPFFVGAPTRVHNVTYSKDLPGEMPHVWMALRIAAVANKLEGCEPEEGKLIVQERMAVVESNPGNNLFWRGAIFKINKDQARGN